MRRDDHKILISRIVTGLYMPLPVVLVLIAVTWGTTAPRYLFYVVMVQLLALLGRGVYAKLEDPK